MNYEIVLFLEFLFFKLDMIIWLEGEEEFQNFDEWQFYGGIFVENEEFDVKFLDWLYLMNVIFQFFQFQYFDSFGFCLFWDIIELFEWSEGYFFYMVMGFLGYDFLVDDLVGKFQFSWGMWCSYDVGFKLMVVEYVESINNCQVVKQFGVLEKNV